MVQKQGLLPFYSTQQIKSKALNTFTCLGGWEGLSHLVSCSSEHLALDRPTPGIMSLCIVSLKVANHHSKPFSSYLVIVASTVYFDKTSLWDYSRLTKIWDRVDVMFQSAFSAQFWLVCCGLTVTILGWAHGLGAWLHSRIAARLNSWVKGVPNFNQASIIVEYSNSSEIVHIELCQWRSAP
jgi:hypothetical protein